MFGGAVGGKKKYYYCPQKGLLEESVSSIMFLTQLFNPLSAKSRVNTSKPVLQGSYQGNC